MNASPDWRHVQGILGKPVHELIRGWTQDRVRHMVPDRTAEVPAYSFTMVIPFAIQRDLGRHRMATQLESALDPSLGYGRDPLLGKGLQEFVAVDRIREMALASADRALSSWMAVGVPPSAIQYACPLATMVRVHWVVNLRELVHVLGLRTTPQGHPAYRAVVQALGKLMSSDPIVKPLVDAVVNYEDIIVGRPG